MSVSPATGSPAVRCEVPGCGGRVRSRPMGSGRPLTVCDDCEARVKEVAVLKSVIAKLQADLRRRLGRVTSAIIDDLSKHPKTTAPEIAKRLKRSATGVRQVLWKLKRSGFVRRVAWRDIPDKTRPEPEWEL